MASSSLDGRVCIRGFLTSEQDHDADLGLGPNLGPGPGAGLGRQAALSRSRPATAVSIDPIFARSGAGRRFMTGDDDRVLMHEKGFLNRYKQTVLCEGEGPIGTIIWRGR